MGRTTIKDVRAKVTYLDTQTNVALSFRCWGVGTNRYQLLNKETGETYTGVCHGAGEFISTLRGFESGLRL